MNARQAENPGTTTHSRTGEQSVTHRRTFAADAATVQRLHVEDPLFAQWMGPRGTYVDVERFDVFTGGGFRYVVRSHDGGAWAFRGSYHLVEPGRIVHTWEYEGELTITLETLTFTDTAAGHSELEIVSVYNSPEACEEVITSGIDGGMDENFERIDELLLKIAD